MTTRSYPFWRVDVFTHTPLAGNPLAVFPRASGLSDAEMLAITREMNISETTFILPPKDRRADYRNRIFTPGGELPFAGHPSLGTAYVAAMEGIVPLRNGSTTIHQEVGIGVLPLELVVRGKRVERVVMTQGRPKVGPPIRKVEALAKALGILPRDITATGLHPGNASTGISSLQVPIRSLETVREMVPDMAALGRVTRKLSGETGDVGVYVFTFEAEGDSDLHARGFFPLYGIPEDPATGSAAGACGAFLAANRRFAAKEWLVIEQGIEIHHPSRIEVAVAVSRGRPTAVKVGGEVVEVMRGTLSL